MNGGFVLEIEELVVDGVATSERGIVALGLKREMQRLVAERGIPGGLADCDLALLKVANVEIAPNDGAAAIGAKAGRALYGALSR